MRLNKDKLGIRFSLIKNQYNADDMILISENVQDLQQLQDVLVIENAERDFL